MEITVGAGRLSINSMMKAAAMVFRYNVHTHTHILSKLGTIENIKNILMLNIISGTDEQHFLIMPYKVIRKH